MYVVLACFSAEVEYIFQCNAVLICIYFCSATLISKFNKRLHIKKKDFSIVIWKIKKPASNKCKYETRVLHVNIIFVSLNYCNTVLGAILSIHKRCFFYL